ncbi:rhomboid family intramembrane serine protease [Roseimaritima sediminicola]|uniref:rhomboid family intramembrane serine protease n=1 Tax=Roseimaritima sediminicola TaxID=2662066 RepID=UPI001298466E|nr:rhomboid family intramembrane serine protease [Roseimaritima sediminicola]
MRKLGTLPDEPTARRLVDYLLTQRIDATTNALDEPAGAWELWVREEDQMEAAGRILEDFRAAPNDPRFDATAEANQIRKQISAAAKQHARRQRGMPAGAMPGGAAGIQNRPIPVTMAVIVISVLAGLVTSFGNPPINGQVMETPDGDIVVPDQSFGLRLFRGMMMVDPLAYQYGNDGQGNRDPLDRIGRGEVWRLLTPAFLHGSIMHLAFNMLMMFSLGGVIERLHSSGFLAVLVVVTGVVATLAQAFAPPALGGTPLQLGASGVIFGLFGYLWIRPIMQPSYPVRIPQSSVLLILGWGLLCMTPIIPNVANAAHVGGLVAGIVAVPVAVKLRF